MNKHLKIAFFGNTKYSAIDAETLHTKFGLSLIVTKPDKPTGRKRVTTPNPVMQFAKKNNIPAVASDKLDQKTTAEIKGYGPDFIVVADYGLIIPNEILNTAKVAPLNIHHSLLPKYRGPSPAPAAILAGETETGVTIIKMTSDVDAGDIMAQKKYPLGPNETTDTLLTKLNEIGSKLAINVIENYENITPVKQEGSKANFTPRMSKLDGLIDPANPPSPEKLDRMIRAYYPWPGVSAEIETSKQPETRKLRVKFLPPIILPSRPPAVPFLIQPEGKRPMTPKEFANGYPEAFQQIKSLLEI